MGDQERVVLDGREILIFSAVTQPRPQYIGRLTWKGEPGLVVLSKELARLDNRLCRGFRAAEALLVDGGGFFSGSLALRNTLFS